MDVDERLSYSTVAGDSNVPSNTLFLAQPASDYRPESPTIPQGASNLLEYDPLAEVNDFDVHMMSKAHVQTYFNLSDRVVNMRNLPRDGKLNVLLITDYFLEQVVFADHEWAYFREVENFHDPNAMSTGPNGAKFDARHLVPPRMRIIQVSISTASLISGNYAIGSPYFMTAVYRWLGLNAENKFDGILLAVGLIDTYRLVDQRYRNQITEEFASHEGGHGPARATLTYPFRQRLRLREVMDQFFGAVLAMANARASTRVGYGGPGLPSNDFIRNLNRGGFPDYVPDCGSRVLATVLRHENESCWSRNTRSEFRRNPSLDWSGLRGISVVHAPLNPYRASDLNESHGWFPRRQYLPTLARDVVNMAILLTSPIELEPENIRLSPCGGIPSLRRLSNNEITGAVSPFARHFHEQNLDGVMVECRLIRGYSFATLSTFIRENRLRVSL